MQWTNGDYLLTDDRTRIDVDAVADLLKDTYWAPDRSRSKIETSIAHSHCFSLFYEGQQVGFARVLSDMSTFSWIADIVIGLSHRGKGIGKRL
jgi:hypothetical protein